MRGQQLQQQLQQREQRNAAGAASVAAPSLWAQCPRCRGCVPVSGILRATPEAGATVSSSTTTRSRPVNNQQATRWGHGEAGDSGVASWHLGLAAGEQLGTACNMQHLCL